MSYRRAGGLYSNTKAKPSRRVIKKSVAKRKKRVRSEQHIFQDDRLPITEKEELVVQTFLNYDENLYSFNINFIDEYFRFLLAGFDLTPEVYQQIEKFYDDLGMYPPQLWLYREKIAIEGKTELSQIELEKLIKHNESSSLELLNRYPIALEFLFENEEYDLYGTDGDLSTELIEFIEKNLNDWFKKDYPICELAQLKNLPEHILDKLIELLKDQTSSFSSLLNNYNRRVGKPNAKLYQHAVKKYFDNDGDLYLEDYVQIIPTEYLPLQFFIQTGREDISFPKELLIDKFSFLLTADNEAVRNWARKQIEEKNEQ